LYLSVALSQERGEPAFERRKQAFYIGIIKYWSTRVTCKIQRTMHEQNDYLHNVGVCACRSIQPQKSLLGGEYKTPLPAEIAKHVQGKRSLYGTVK
jgi:hypothetical protein